MSSPAIWSSGRYESVAERIASIAAQVVAAVERRASVREAAVVDLACGTGSAAIAAAAAGARVTAVDFTPELLALGAQKADAAALSISWLAGDAAATGLPDGSFDVAVSNMGSIFVEPVTQVAEISRLLRPDGTLGFSSWVHDEPNPFFRPIVDVLGPPPAAEYTPDQWGDPDIIAGRLAAGFTDIDIERGNLTWRFSTLDAAVSFVMHESPLHLAVLGNIEAGQRDRLRAAFEDTLKRYLGDEGGFSYDAPYVVVTARRR